ncbi:hypothetical protein [Paraburkholderia kururiensis]|jgi:hypothetical protein|uniref:Uncharacterized protein n=1 Tax=Paraburkholderia kururiensis TaxID=984307 RepID=A0ABZ0WKW6_9BURK|nr:hypothetical protein [Paraburkholderia kururiensis]WQD78007.1 hypothetical protein U0042_29000 [Paraburkholderia kururiensis]
MHYSIVAALCAVCLASSAYGGDAGEGNSANPGRDPGGNAGAALEVVDAQGHDVGPLVSFTDRTVATVVSVDGAIIVAPLSRASAGGHLSASQFEWSSSTAFPNYPSTDCSGPPIVSSTNFVGSGDAAPVRPSLTIRTGSVATAYIAPDTWSTTIAGQSQVESHFGCIATSTSTSGWLPASTYSLTQNYPEPLTVRFDNRQRRH